MKQKTLYKVTIIVLLTLNLILASFFMLTKKPVNHSHKEAKRGAKEILHLDQDQDRLFKEFSEEHNKSMVLLRDEQKQVAKDYFLQPTDSLLNLITVIEAKKIKSTEKHFENMKSVLKEEQLIYYQDFKKSVLKSILK